MEDEIRKAIQMANPDGDVQFYLLLFHYLKLLPEERLAKGLARGRRKYFLIRK